MDGRAIAGVLAVATSMLILGCASSHGDASGSFARERAGIAAAVKEEWLYESRRPDSLDRFVRDVPRRPHARPVVLMTRILQGKSHYASAVVGIGGARWVVLLRRGVGSANPWGVVAGPAVDFPHACTAATPTSVRALLCPDPWAVLGYPRPPVAEQTSVTQRVASSDLHRIDWRKVVLPGGVCGSSRPVRSRPGFGGQPIGLIRGDVNEPWWNPAVVYSWARPVYGDLDGDGEDEAALAAVCANGGGTAGGQLQFSTVVFGAARRTLRVIGIVTPRQPFTPEVHVPLEFVDRIERGHVVTNEAWYGPFDGTCCGSGRARTTWTYRAGRLEPTRVRVIRPIWTSPVRVVDVLAEPGDEELNSEDNSPPYTRLPLPSRLGFDVWLENLGDVATRNVKVTLAILQGRERIEKTGSIARVAPYSPKDAILHFRNLEGVHLGKATVVIRLHLPGATPVRYRISVVRHK